MQMLEVALGLIAYFLLMSMVASAIIDLLENRVRKKGRILLKAVRTACGSGHAFTAAFYRHPRIEILYEGPTPSTGHQVEEARTLRTAIASLNPFGGAKTKIQNLGLPSAIPNEAFARAFLETLIATNPEEVRDLRPLFSESTRRWEHPLEEGAKTDNVGGQPIPKNEIDDAYRVVRPFVLEANGEVVRTLALLSTHFNNVNDRAAGWYKRWVSNWLFISGLVLALASNGDALRIVGRLNSDPSLRADMVRLAEAYGSKSTNPSEAGVPQAASGKEIKEALGTAEAVSGDWSHDPLFILPKEGRSGWSWIGLSLAKLIGLVLSAVAISLGAPFWFQILQTLLKLRGGLTGKGQAEPSELAPQALIKDAQELIRSTEATKKAANLAANSPELGAAAACAALSASAYLSTEAFKESLHRKDGTALPVVRFISQSGKVQLTPDTQLTIDTQVYIVREDAQLTIVFRGTEPKVPADLITDARFLPTPVEWARGVSGAQVHRGFSAALEAVWGELAKSWQTGPEAPKQVRFCGHSLGGALAVLAAVRFLAEAPEHDELFQGLYTIGQPRVGNEPFASWAAALLRGRYLRTINNRDAVPRVPPASLGYRHFGSVHYFDADGKLLCDPSWLFRFIDTSIPAEDLNKLSGSQWMLTMKEAGSDHSSDNYVSLYKQVRLA